MSGVNFEDFALQVGLEEISKPTQKELATNIMPACVVGLSDGDLFALHPEYSGLDAELYGKHNLADGKVAKAVLKAALDNGMNPGLVYDFQSYAASYFTHPLSPFASYDAHNSVKIEPKMLRVDGDQVRLAEEPSLVVDFNACLTSRSYLTDQLDFWGKHGKRPFAYSPLTRLHFTNQSLINTYSRLGGPGTSKVIMENGLYIGREDGVSSATNEIIRAQKEHGAPTDVADIILCTNAQHATRVDLKHGIENAHSIVKEGGIIVVRSLAHPTSKEIGTDEITGWAFESGFDERNVRYLNASLNPVSAILSTGHFENREVKTAILTKK